MRICKKCLAPEADGVCPLCGNKKSFRDATDEDSVYLTSCEYLWSRTVEDALAEAGIVFFRHGSLGMGLTVSVGDLAEMFRYYVAFPDYEKALAVLPPDMAEMSEDELNAYIDTLGEETEEQTLG